MSSMMVMRADRFDMVVRVYRFDMVMMSRRLMMVSRRFTMMMKITRLGWFFMVIITRLGWFFMVVITRLSWFLVMVITGLNWLFMMVTGLRRLLIAAWLFVVMMLSHISPFIAITCNNIFPPLNAMQIHSRALLSTEPLP